MVGRARVRRCRASDEKSPKKKNDKKTKRNLADRKNATRADRHVIARGRRCKRKAQCYSPRLLFAASGSCGSDESSVVESEGGVGMPLLLLLGAAAAVVAVATEAAEAGGRRAAAVESGAARIRRRNASRGSANIRSGGEQKCEKGGALQEERESAREERKSGFGCGSGSDVQ